MRGVAGQHRAATGLGNVADQNAVPDAFGLRLARSLRKPIIAGFPHMRLRDRRTTCRNRRRPAAPSHLQSAARIETDRARLGLDRRHRPPEHFLGREPRVGGIGERRQRFRVEVSLVLGKRQRGPGDGDRESDADGRIRRDMGLRTVAGPRLSGGVRSMAPEAGLTNGQKCSRFCKRALKRSFDAGKGLLRIGPWVSRRADAMDGHGDGGGSPHGRLRGSDRSAQSVFKRQRSRRSTARPFRSPRSRIRPFPIAG